MAKEFDIGTLSPADKDEIKAFQNIRDTLFPDGNIPTRDEVEAKINSGKYNVRDVYLAKMYTQGMDTAPLVEEFPDTKEFAKKFKKAFSLKRDEAAALPKGFSKKLLKSLEKVSLEDSFDEVGHLLDDKGPLNSAIDKVKKGKFPTGIKGKQKLGKELGKYTPELIQAMARGISQIPDDKVKAAVVTQLFGARQVDILEMRTTKQLAERGVQKRPYFDIETGEQVNPERGSRKKAGPTKVMPPVTAELLKKIHSQAGITGEMFPNITNKQIDNALKNYVFKAIPKNILDKLDKAPSTFTDLRRITAAFVLNQLGDAKSASEIISHSAAGLDEKIDKVMLKFYADMDDTNVVKRTQGLILFEKELAKGLGVTNAKQLATKLDLKLPDTFNAEYPITKFKIDETGTIKTETKTATAAQIERGKNIEEAQDVVTEQELLLTGEQKKSKGLDLRKANLNKQMEIIELEKKVKEGKASLKDQNRLNELTNKGTTKTSANNLLNKYEQENPDNVPSKGKKKRRFTPRSLLSVGPLGYLASMYFIPNTYKLYKNEYLEDGYEEDEATAKATAMTLADITPVVSETKMLYETSIDPRDYETTPVITPSSEWGLEKENYGMLLPKDDLHRIADEEQEVGSEMMRKYKQQSALSQMKEESQQKLDNQLQKLNIRRE